MDRRLDAVVDELLRRAGGGDVPLAPLARDELKLLVYEARAGVPVEALAADAKRLVREPLDLHLARAVGDDAGLGGRSGLDREATRLSYPTWLLEAWVEDYGAAEATALAEAMNQRAPMAVRVNTARIAREALAAQLAEEHVVARPTALSPVGLVFETRVNAFGLSAFRDGLFEVMDEGSQLVAEAGRAAAGRPRARRLRRGRRQDAGAGRGAGGEGPDAGARHRRQEAGGAAAAGAPGGAVQRAGEAVTATAALGDIAKAAPGTYDRVLVDAPCSGLGTLRRNPEARWRLRRAELDAISRAPARPAGQPTRR